MIRMRSIFEIEIRKISPCGSRSPDNAEFGHFTLLFCRGRQRNVPRINNYWMRLSMISWIIKTEVCVICRNRRLKQITQTRGFDNSWYHAKTEFNNCFIIHFSYNSSSETEKRNAQPFCFWGEHSKGLSNREDVELDMINAISAADIAFIMSGSLAIVNC